MADQTFDAVIVGFLGVEVLLQRVVDGDDVFLPALLVQPKLPALALREVVVDLQSERGADAGERVA